MAYKVGAETHDGRRDAEKAAKRLGLDSFVSLSTGRTFTRERNGQYAPDTELEYDGPLCIGCTTGEH